MTADRWDCFETVRDLTTRLVRVRAVSPTADERAVADTILDLLTEDGLADAYTAVGLDALEGDTYARNNVYALVQGQRSATLVLLGHFDTVDTADYGPLEPWATDPDGLAARLDHLAALTPGLQADLDAHPGEWLFGRGSIDMKSGVAANLAVIRRLAAAAAQGVPPAISVLFLATPDEETESAGVLQAVRFLARLRAERGLTYLGAVNTDYTTAEYPGDPHHYIYTGTVGKLLPSFLVVGRESHVGQPFDGVDANLLAAELIRDLSMNDALCDQVRGQATPPPVTLHASDLKARYDVQLPFAAHFYLNVLTFTTTPAALLDRLRAISEAALARALARLDACEARWVAASGGTARVHAARTGRVHTYAELRAVAERQHDPATVAAVLAEEAARWPADLDKRARSLHLVWRLWTLSGLDGPAVVIAYAPPYYPHVAAAPGALDQAVAAVADSYPDLHLVTREFYPYISDMSYLRLDAGVETAALTANMPLWAEPEAAGPGDYTLPLDAIRAMDLPVVNLGPYGRGAHQRGEAVLMPYSFGILPQLLWEVIERVGES
jgi:arginine utilization protein RocB